MSTKKIKNVMSKDGFFHIPDKNFNVMLGYTVSDPKSKKNYKPEIELIDERFCVHLL